MYDDDAPAFQNGETINSDQGASAAISAPPTDPDVVLIAGAGPAGPVTVPEATKIGTGVGSVRVVANGKRLDLEATGLAATNIQWMGMMWFPQIAG